ncbi:MAG: helix-turn-helix domain-containing protein [Solirubrobacterales bacterium]
MTTAAEQFGQNLRAIRKQAGLSQEAVQFASGVHRTVISKIERGETGPCLVTIVRLVNLFEVPIGDFFAGLIHSEPHSAVGDDNGADPTAEVAGLAT